MNENKMSREIIIMTVTGEYDCKTIPIDDGRREKHILGNYLLDIANKYCISLDFLDYVSHGDGTDYQIYSAIIYDFESFKKFIKECATENIVVKILHEYHI